MSSDEKRPLGKIALQRKLVSQADLDAALKAKKRDPSTSPVAGAGAATGGAGGEGEVDEVQVLRGLSEQHGIPGIDLLQIAIVLEQLDAVPREVAETHSILPVLVRGDRMFLAMADPHDKRVVDELEFVTGKKVFSYIAVPSTLVRTIADAYDAKARGEPHYLGPNVPAETLRQLGIEPAGQNADAIPPEPPSSRQAVGPAPIVTDEAVATAAAEAEVSTGDFGELGDEVSSIASQPDDLRQRAAQAADSVASGAGKLVLIVDDEEEIRKMVKRLLTPHGYRVIEADRGLLALRLVKDHTPDLIVLDAMLPELHGFDIARRIKGSAKYGSIPVVMISAVYRGWRIAEDLKQNYGVDEYFEKPFKITELLDAVQRLLARDDGADRTGAPGAGARDPDYLSAEAENALNAGIAAYKAGKTDEAIEQLRRGIAIDPLSYRLRFHVALLYGKKGRVYDGIQELERAIELNPRHFPALKNLAVLYEKACFKNKAVETWERSLAAAPDDDTRATIKEHLLKLI